METSNDDDAVIEPTTEQTPKIGHDNKVFSDETGLSHMPRQSHHQNGRNNGQVENAPQRFRIIENSRL